MLNILRRIVQEVNATPDLAAAMQIMVQRVRETVDTRACTLYLIDNRSSEYVLAATDGLNPAAVGKLRVEIDTGLVGLVGRREEPINLEDAPTHPNFLHRPELGEEKFRAFLGVPVIHHRRLFGILVVQQEEQRRFDDEEEAFLVTIAVQIAAILAHAHATGRLLTLFRPHATLEEDFDEPAIGGIPSVPGVGIGLGVIVYPLADLDAVPEKTVTDVASELENFVSAVSATKVEIAQLRERMHDSLPADELALFDVYLRILDSESLVSEVKSYIDEGNWAQGAMRRVFKKHIAQFEAMDDEYLRERATDLRDIGRRILRHLQAGQTETIEYPDQVILVGEEVTASALAEVPEGHLAGVVSASGSSNSHVAILARALGVPTVMAAKGLSLNQLAGHQLVVDGYFGQVYVSPSVDLLAEFEVLAGEERELDASLEELRGKPAQTPDGHSVALFVNTGLAADAGLSLSVGAEGVGLYRSEVPFMIRDRFPVEEEQRVIYRQLLNAFAPRPVTMRTLDIGGDKALAYFPIKEDNPFLGWRGVRVTLDHPEIFLVQLRAMLRANEGLGNLRVLFPMISSVGEVDEAISLLEQAYSELIDDGLDIIKPPVGVMIEVPSAVYQTRDLAKRADFISVGSNDLTQYLLAVDRNNSRVAGLYESLHPALLRALLQVVEGGHSEGKPVSICGEMTSDPVSIILLLAMGFDMLSMNSTSLPRMKWVIRNFTLAYARKLLSEVLEMDNAALIRFHLEKALDQAGLGGLIRAGKK